jgi:threonine/homoserine/homoserine lactone efflux protein
MTAFLAGVIAISLSGAVLPGPLTAVLVTRGHRDRFAGSWVLLGHAAVELPLVILIRLGLVPLLGAAAARAAVAALGGAMLIFVGWSLFKERDRVDFDARPRGGGTVLAAMAASLSPPFFLWWLTAGSALIVQSTSHGAGGFALFLICHLAVDGAWFLLVTQAVHRSRHLWTPAAHRLVFVLCGLAMWGFGAYFLLSLRSLLRA